jgi:hypothetical protein
MYFSADISNKNTIRKDDSLPVSFFYILFSFRLIFIGMPFVRIGSVIYNLEEYHLTYIGVIFDFY